MLRRSKGLQSKKQLQSKTPLKRGSGLKSSAQLKSSKRIPPRSKKTQKVYETRRALVELLLKERPRCEACLVFAAVDPMYATARRQSVDIHEIVSRGRGGSIVEIANLLAVCRTCHTRITENPWQSEELGLSLPSTANNEDGFAEAARRRKKYLKGGLHG